jgi:hypothetical protein
MAATQKIKRERCLLCGGLGPNTYGECLCSYDPVMFSGDYKKIAIRLVRVIKNLMVFLK